MHIWYIKTDKLWVGGSCMLSCYHSDSCFIAQGPPKSQPKINGSDIKRLVSPWEVISAMASFIWKPADDQQGQDLAPHL